MSEFRLCPACKVRVLKENEKCPLCRRETVTLQEDGINFLSSSSWYPSYENLVIKRKKNFLLKLFSFIGISAIGITTVINLLTGGDFWFLYIIPSIIYAWITAFHTVISRSHLGSKIVVQVFSISVLLVWINWVNGGERWSVNYVVPFLAVGATLAIGIISFFKRMRKREFSGYLIALVFLGIAPIILYALGVSSVLWSAVMSAMLSALTFIAMLIFARKNIRNELGRIFHF